MSNSHMVMSPLFEDLWSSSEMRNIFSDDSRVQAWIDVEVAIAKAQSRLQLIPSEAADEILRQGTLSNFDLSRMASEIVSMSHPLMSFINQFRESCDGGWGQYVHWGATTQDIVDTGAMIQWKAATGLVGTKLRRTGQLLASIARREARTVMAGRTHHQQAIPITFGYKVGSWLDEVTRAIERLDGVRRNCLVASIGGAVGTMAYVGAEHAAKIRGMVAEELDLVDPVVPWQASRDRVALIVSELAIAGNSLGRIGHELSLLQKSEIREVLEPHPEEHIGSSTMPHKHNPNLAETIVSASIILGSVVGAAFPIMQTEHERDDSKWQVEGWMLPQAFLVFDGQISNLMTLLEGLEVRRETMSENMVAEISGEAIMRALANRLGRHHAHDLLHKAFANLENASIEGIVDSLIAIPEIAASYTDEDIREMCAVEGYLGDAPGLAVLSAERFERYVGEA